MLQFDNLHNDDLSDYTSEINYNIASPMVERICLPEDLDQLDIQNQRRNIIYDDFELSCSMESLQYHCSEDIEHDYELTWSSSPPSGDLRTDLIHMSSHLDTKMEQVQESRRIVDFDYFENLSLSCNGSVYVTPNDKTPGKREASSLTKYRKDPDLFHEENSTPNVYQSASSHGSNPTPQTAESGKFFETCDDKEVLPVACMNCYSTEALNLGDEVESFKVHKDKNDRWDKIKEEHESQGIVKSRELPYGIFSNTSGCLSEESLSCQSYYLPQSCKWDQKGKCPIISYKDNESSYSVETGSHEEITPCTQKTAEVLSTIVKLDTDGKELNMDSPALASNAVVLGDCEKPSTLGDDPSDFCKGDAAQDIGDGGQIVLDMTINDVVVPVNCDEVVSLTESFIANLSSKHGFDPANRSEHTRVVHVKVSLF